MKHGIELALRRPNSAGRRLLKAPFHHPLVTAVAVCAVLAALMPTIPLGPVAHHRTSTARAKPRHIHYALTSSSAPITTGPVSTWEYVTIGSANEVEVLNEATDSVVGSPIPVGTNPDAIDFWPGLDGSHPEVVEANKNTNTVKVIDAVTASVVATVTLPSGASPTGIAASPAVPYALVVDSGLDEVSVIDLQNNTLVGSESLPFMSGTAGAITFSADGLTAFVTDAAAHEIAILPYDTSGTDNFDVSGSPYIGSSTFDPVGIATDMTNAGATALYVADSGGSGSLDTFSYSLGLLNLTTTKGISAIPGDLTVAPGGADVYLQVPGSKKVVDVSIGSTEVATPITTSVASAGPVAVSSDTSALFVADATTSSTDNELMSTASDEPVETATLAGPVTAVVTARPAPVTPSSSASTVAYVAVGSANEVEAVDEQTGAVIGSPIPVGTNPDGLAVWSPGAETHPQVLVANATSSTVSVIDAVTERVVGTISNFPMSADPTAVAVNSVQNAKTGSRFGMVVDSALGDVSVINLQTDADVGEIPLPLGAGPSQIAYAPGGLSAYVTDPSTHKIAVLNWNGNAANDYYTLGTTFTDGGSSTFDPVAIAADETDPSSNTIYVTDSGDPGSGCTSDCLDTLSNVGGSLSLVSAKTVSSTPNSLAVSPGAGLVYVQLPSTNKVAQVATGTGTVTSITTTASAGPVAVSADSSVLLVGDATTGSTDTELMSTATDSSANTATVTGPATAIATAKVTPLDDLAYVTNAHSNTVSVIDTTSGTVIQTIAVGTSPEGVAVTPDGSSVYVGNSVSGTISVIKASEIAVPGVGSPVSSTITLTATGGGTPWPSALAMSPNGDSLLVADGDNGAVEVVDTNAGDGAHYDTQVNEFSVTCSGTTSSIYPPQIAISPDGAFAYVTDQTTAITVLKAAAATTTGFSCLQEQTASSLNPLSIFGPTHDPSAETVGVAVSPNDETLYVTDTDDSDLFAFTIGSSGLLAPALPISVSVGGDPTAVALSPQGQTAYVEANADNYPATTDVVSTTSDTVTATFSSGYGLNDATAPDGRQLAETDYYIANGVGSFGDTVGVWATSAEGAAPPYGNLQEVIVGSATGPWGVAYAPQPLAPSDGTPSPAELADGDANPSESGVSGNEDVVSTETPQNLPGASAGVNTGLGTYSFSLDAMSVPDVGISLDLSLTYDSAHASTAGAFGYGWSFSYGMTATQNAYNASNPCEVTITQEDGSTVAFQPSVSSGFTSGCPGLTYEPEPWVQASLSVVSSCNGSDSCWDLTRSNGTQYEIDQTNGELVKEIDTNGNTGTLKYGAVSGVSGCSSNTSTELCEVIGESGVRTLVFTWTSGEVTSVTDGTRTVTLTYSSSDLATISLTPASGSGALTPKYAFSYSSNLMTSWWDPDKEASNAGQTGYATDVIYGTGSGTCPANTTSEVCYVTAPQIVDSGTSMTATYVPQSDFAFPSTYPTYPALDPSTGTGTVEVTDPNYNASLEGGDVTLDTYVDHVLVSQTEGYGPNNRTISGTLSTGSQTLTGSTFTQADVGRSVQDTSNPGDIPAGTTIISVQSSTQATMSSPATASASGDSVLLGVMSPETISFGDPLNFATYESLDPLGNVTTASVDAEANTLASTDPMGRTTSSLYNGFNEVTSSTDALGDTTANTYDSHGDELTTTDPMGDVTTNAYNSNGTLCATMNANGNAVGAAAPACFTPVPTHLTTALTNGTNYTSLHVSPAMTAANGTTVLVFQGTNEVSTTLSAAASGSTTLSVTSFKANYSYTTSAFVAFVSPYVTEYGYDAEGDQTSTTAYDGPSTSVTQAYTTTELYNSVGQECASLTADGFAAGDTLPSSCPSSGAAYETVNIAFDYYGNVLSSISPANAAGGTTTNSYDGNGDELTTDSPSGTATSSAYGADNQLCWSEPALVTSPKCVSPPTGTGTETTTDFYDADLNEVAFVSPDGNAQTTYPECVYESISGFDDFGNTVLSTTPIGGTSCSNEATSETWSTYDTAGDEVTSTVEPPPGQTTNVTTTSAYDSDGEQCWTDLAVISNPTCSSPPIGPLTSTTTTSYDADSNPVATITADGNASGTPYDYATTSAYNAAGSLAAQTLPPPTSTGAGVDPGETTTDYYDADANEVAVTNAAGNPGSCDPLITSGCPYTDYTTYDQQNRQLSSSDADGDTMGYTYDADGNQTTASDSAGETTTSTYDGLDQPCWSEPEPVTTASCASPPTGSGTETSMNYYDASSNIVATTGPGGNPYSSGNPSGCNPITTSTCTNTTYYAYNTAGQLLSTNNPGNNLTTNYYDATGRVVALTGPSGNPYSSGNPGGCNPLTTSTCSDTAYYTYNQQGQLTQISYTDGTPTVTFAYSTSGLECWMYSGASANSCTSPPSGATIYAYDATGQLTSVTNSAGATVTYGYDANSDLACISYPNSADNTCSSSGTPSGVIRYSYNQTGQLSTLTDWAGDTFTVTYNSDGQECWISTYSPSSPQCGSPPADPNTVTMSYAYDQSGNTTAINTTTGAPASTLLDLGAGSQMVANCTTTSDSDVVTTTGSFTTAGVAVGMSVSGAGIEPGTFVQLVNSSSQITLSTPSTSSGTSTLAFASYNPDNNLVRSVPTIGSSTYPPDTYSYDSSGQITSGPIAGSSGNSAYAYTPAGNLTTDTTYFGSAGYNSGGSLCWTYTGSSSNACTSPPSGSSVYSYNADGERIGATPSSGSGVNPMAYSWNTLSGELTCANTDGSTCSTTSPTGTTTVYGYDGDGLRVSATVGSGSPTEYTWDVSDGLPRVVSDGTWDYVYIPGQDAPLEQISATGSSPSVDILLGDENGNVRGLVQLSSGSHEDQLVNYSDYDAYGVPITKSGGSAEAGGLTVTHTGLNTNYVGTTSWGYGDSYVDLTGLVYMVGRYYDPTTGQFLSVDPDLDATMQPYEFADDNGVNEIDPLGESACHGHVAANGYNGCKAAQYAVEHAAKGPVDSAGGPYCCGGCWTNKSSTHPNGEEGWKRSVDFASSAMNAGGRRESSGWHKVNGDLGFSEDASCTNTWNDLGSGNPHNGPGKDTYLYYFRQDLTLGALRPISGGSGQTLYWAKGGSYVQLDRSKLDPGDVVLYNFNPCSVDCTRICGAGDENCHQGSDTPSAAAVVTGDGRVYGWRLAAYLAGGEYTSSNCTASSVLNARPSLNGFVFCPLRAPAYRFTVNERKSQYFVVDPGR